MDLGFIVVIVLIIAFMPFVYITTRTQEEKEETINNETEMEIHCKVVSQDKDYYWTSGIRCGVICCYKEECKKYVKKYGKLPNGEKSNE